MYGTRLRVAFGLLAGLVSAAGQTRAAADRATVGASCSAPQIVSMWGGARHSIVLRSDGTVWTWGLNAWGLLGDGTASTWPTDFSNDRHLPVQVHGAGDVGFLGSIVAIMGGEPYNFALRSDGTVWAWGANTFGEVGDGTNTDRWVPVPVSGLGSVVALGGRGYHSLALRSDGTVWTWGFNTSGQLGNGTTTSSNVPVQVTGLSQVLAVTGGGFFSVALMSDHTLRAWGHNAQGEVGDGTTTNRTTPVAVSGLSNVSAVSGGWAHAVALRADGTVWTWGKNQTGQLGDGTVVSSSVPLQVPGLSGVVAVSGGDCHTAALESDGTVWTWGCNDVGELGDGTNTERHAPVQVVGLSNVIAITARDYHNLALTADGTLWAWGSNNHGQLGDGTTTDRNAPVLVAPVGSLGLAPTNLPDAVVGTAYDQTLQTTGGTPPYTFSVHSGALPTGLALAPTGAVSGVPTAAGDFAFSVDATDANGCTATASYTLSVATTAAPVACAGALFCDDFADGVLARDWTYTTPSWNEAGGELVGTVKRRTSQAVASPAFAGCSLCTFATSMASDRGRLAFEPWYRDPRNTVVVLMSRRGRRFVMRQVQNGATVARVRLKADRHGPGQPHDVSVTFDGTMLTLTVDDKPPVGMRAVGVVQGTASFLAKRTTGRFGFILVR